MPSEKLPVPPVCRRRERMAVVVVKLTATLAVSAAVPPGEQLRERLAVEQPDELLHAQAELRERAAARVAARDVQRPLERRLDRPRRPGGVIGEEGKAAEREGACRPQDRPAVEPAADAAVVEEERRDHNGGDDPEEVRLVVDAEPEGEGPEHERAEPPAPPPVDELPEPDRLEEEHEDRGAEVDAGVEDEARVGREEDDSDRRDRGATEEAPGEEVGEDE